MTYSGLSPHNCNRARDRAVGAAMVGYHHKSQLHYTTGSRRWQGIQLNLNANAGHFPDYADCSSFATWCLWNGLWLLFRQPDKVNGCSWRAGFTGTLLQHGWVVRNVSKALPGDLVLYGRGYPGVHTAIIVKQGRTPMVISNGSEAGPFYLPWNYRSDIMGIRRYF